MKREIFFINKDIFNHSLNGNAIAVFAYLSYCCNKSGMAFPSVKKIAAACGMASSTVRKAIDRLIECGMLIKEYSYMKSTNGKNRQTSNKYYLAKAKITEGVTPTEEQTHMQNSSAPTPSDSEEIDNNVIYMSNSLSVCPYEELTERLQLHLYEDKDFAECVRLAIKEMYYAESITVNGNKIPQEQIRDRLKQLNMDCIDRVYRCFENYGGEIYNAKNYLISCIYNAPLDHKAMLAAFAASM